MNLRQTIWLSLATGFFMIGIHQIFISTASDISGKIFDGYWAIMLSGGCFLAYKFLTPKQPKEETDTKEAEKKPPRRPQVEKKKKRKRKK